jgi:hypothetical protein
MREKKKSRKTSKIVSKVYKKWLKTLANKSVL